MRYAFKYAFNCDSREIATVSKKFFSWTDSCGVDIADGEDDVVMLASCVVIDLCCHGDRGEHRT
jgi:uncharacterized protein YxjI